MLSKEATSSFNSRSLILRMELSLRIRKPENGTRKVPIYFFHVRPDERNGCVTHTWWSGLFFHINADQNLNLNLNFKQTKSAFQTWTSVSTSNKCNMVLQRPISPENNKKDHDQRQVGL